MPTKLLLLGSGGHAKVIVDAVKVSLPQTEIILADENVAVVGQKLFGEISIEPFESWSSCIQDIHISIGNNEARQRLFVQAKEAGKSLITVIHPLTSVALGVQLGGGCFIAAHATISSDTFIGQGCIVNHAAVVDHDCKIGDFSHIAPSVTLGGGVTVGRMCLIGAGAVVLPDVVIGDNVVVGAGSVVTKNISANKVVVGIPARSVNK